MKAQKKRKSFCRVVTLAALGAAVLCCNLFLYGKAVYTTKAGMEEVVEESGLIYRSAGAENTLGNTGKVKVDSTTDPNGEVYIRLGDGAWKDGQVYLVTYEIYDEDGAFVGLLEHRAGKEVDAQTWLTANGKTEHMYPDYPYVRELNPFVTMWEWRNAFPETEDAVYNDYSYKVTGWKVLTEKITPITDVAWDTSKTSKWIVWEPVEGAGGYQITLKRDGVARASYQWFEDMTELNLAAEIDKEGTYTVDIKVVGGREKLDSDVTTDVLTYDYVFPEDKLGAPEQVWWTSKEGGDIPAVVNWNPVPGAKGYLVRLQAYEAENPDRYMTGVSLTVENNENDGFGTQCDLEHWLNVFNKEAGKKGMTYTYQVSVQALSGNIELFANTSRRQTAKEYETRDSLDMEVKEGLLAGSLFTAIENYGMERVADVMMNSGDVLAEVRQAEAQHREEKGVTVLDPVSTVAGFNARKIKVEGAALNVESGTVGLVIKEAESKITLDSDLYHNGRLVDISLMTDSGALTELKVPVIITMDAPGTIAPERLIILHYHNGRIETIHPLVNEDGSITFSVTGFSTFAFAGITMYDENGKEDIAEPGKPIEEFVTRMYRIVLEREPDAGSGTWIDGLMRGTFSGVRVADGFVMSDEFMNKDISNEAFVQILYRAFFGREADPEGLATWTGLLDAGCKKTYVFAGFANSIEFGDLCAEAGIIQGRAAEYLADRQTGLSEADYKVWCFVERMYMEVLNRTADEPGVRSWVGALQDGSMTGVQVADGFIMSEEFLAKNMTNEEYVRIMYRAFFGRDADPEGLATWTNALATGWTKQEVFAGFANSNEFGVLCGQAGIVQGVAEGK